MDCHVIKVRELLIGAIDSSLQDGLFISSSSDCSCYIPRVVGLYLSTKISPICQICQVQDMIHGRYL